MSVLSEQGQGTVAGLSDAGALRTQRDKNGNVINSNQQQLVFAARRQSQKNASVDMEEQRRKDFAFIAWAPDSPANKAKAPSQPFSNAALQAAKVVFSRQFAYLGLQGTTVRWG